MNWATQIPPLKIPKADEKSYDSGRQDLHSITPSILYCNDVHLHGMNYVGTSHRNSENKNTPTSKYNDEK